MDTGGVVRNFFTLPRRGGESGRGGASYFFTSGDHFNLRRKREVNTATRYNLHITPSKRGAMRSGLIKVIGFLGLGEKCFRDSGNIKGGMTVSSFGDGGEYADDAVYFNYALEERGK